MTTIRPRMPGGGARRVLAALVVPAIAGAIALTATAPALPASAVSAAEAPPLRLRALDVHDRLAGSKAFRMLVPLGWRASGGIVWDFRYYTLASAVMQVRSPSGSEALETYPVIPHVWDTRGIAGFPQGSNYLGSIVYPPLDAVPFLEQLAMPRDRGGLRYRVVSRTRLAKVARTLSGQPRKIGLVTSSNFDAARVRIEYAQGGRLFQEDFYTVLSYTTSPLLPNAVRWQPHFLYSFRAPRGRLDRSTALLQAMTASVRVDLRWYAGLQHVQQLWIDGQMQSIRAAGALSRAVSQANAQITDSLRSSYRQQQDAYDRVYDSFSEQIRGVETYRDPFAGRDVQLPSDYSNAWVSAAGEYVLSNDAGFNPNVGSTVDWRLLRPS